MKKFERTLLLPLVIMALLLTNSGCASPLITRAEGLTDMGDPPAEAKLLSLLRGLELRASQMRFIIEKAQQAEQIRDELVSGDEYQAEMTRIAREVKVILEQDQIYTLVHSGPWVTPSQNGAQIRQVDAATATEEALASVRTKPDAELERGKEEISRRLLEHLKIHLPGGSILIISEEEEVTRIVSILDQAKGLSDLEFELQKAALAQKVLFAFGLHESPVDTCLQIEKHLLDPMIIPLLEETLGPLAGNAGDCSG